MDKEEKRRPKIPMPMVHRRAAMEAAKRTPTPTAPEPAAPPAAAKEAPAAAPPADSAPGHAPPPAHEFYTEKKG